MKNSLEMLAMGKRAESRTTPNGMPGYAEVYRLILKDIRDMKLRPGSSLPSLRNLCERYGTSMMTVRKALGVLAEEGVVDRQHGRGNFVREVRKMKLSLLTTSRYCREPLTTDFLQAINDCSHDYEVTPSSLDSLDADSVRRFRSEHGHPSLVLAASELESMARDDLLLPLDDMPGFQEVLQDLPPGLDYRNIGPDGKCRHYWLPMFLHPTVFALNQGLARQCGLPDDRAPADWDELLEWTEQFMQWSGDRPYAPAMTYGYPNRLVTTNLSYLGMGGGGARFSTDSSELSRPNIESFVDLFARLVSMNAMVYPTGGRDHERFADGTCLCHLSALPWFAYEVERYNPGLSAGFFPVPPNERGGPRISTCWSLRLGIARPPEGSSREVGEICWEACRDMFSHERLPELGHGLKCMPARISCRDEVLSANPRLQGFYDAFVDAQFVPNDTPADLRRRAADAFLTPFFVGHRMLDDSARIARMLCDMTNHAEWDYEVLEVPG